MPIIPLINFGKGASRTGSVSHTGKIFGKVYTAKAMCWDWLEDSEENGDSQKEELR